MKIAITIKDTLEHTDNSIFIKDSLNLNWVEYHGDGNIIPQKNSDTPMSRTWMAEIEEEQKEITFWFVNSYQDIEKRFLNVKLEKCNKLLKLRKYNEKILPDKLDDVVEIPVDYWIEKNIYK